MGAPLHDGSSARVGATPRRIFGDQHRNGRVQHPAANLLASILRDRDRDGPGNGRPGLHDQPLVERGGGPGDRMGVGPYAHADRAAQAVDHRRRPAVPPVAARCLFSPRWRHAALSWRMAVAAVPGVDRDIDAALRVGRGDGFITSRAGAYPGLYSDWLFHRHLPGAGPACDIGCTGTRKSRSARWIDGSPGGGRSCRRHAADRLPLSRGAARPTCVGPRQLAQGDQDGAD